MERQPRILIFKTNIQTREQKRAIASLLNSQVSIESWTIDQEDEDCVLRIVGFAVDKGEIIDLLKKQHFDCIELH